MGAKPDGIILRDLCKTFGNVKAVDHLTLNMGGRGVFALLGPNGAGKSTTIGIICGSVRPDSGTVEVRMAHASLGYCPQALCIWPNLTCMEQLMFVGSLYGNRGEGARKKCMGLLEALGLGDKAHSLARTLSGGMQRRLNMALSLVHDPAILVLDEPEAGLDSQSRVLVREYIRGLAGSKCVILTTHDMDEADRMADRIGIIDHGRLLVEGTPEELKRGYGKGEVVEFDLPGSVDPPSVRRSMILAEPDASVGVDGYTLTVGSRDAIGRIPRLLEGLSSLGVRPVSMRMRGNTLEDVFIGLTGRRLRQ